MGPEYGFHINLYNTQAYAFSSRVPPLQVGCPFSAPEGFAVLGTPVDTDSYVDSFLQKKQQEIDGLLEDLLTLEDPQTAFHMHLFYASVCEVMPLLRTLPITQTTALAASFDEKQRRSFERLNRACTDKGWAQATLLLGDGGLGLTPTSVVVEAAFLASVIDTTALVSQIYQIPETYARERIYAAISLWQAKWPSPPPTLSTTSLLERATSPIPNERLQHVLTPEIHDDELNSTYAIPHRKSARESSRLPHHQQVLSFLPC